jgi:hypothetical protein
VSKPATSEFRKFLDEIERNVAEDRDMACAAQRGLAARANDVFTFGLFEGAIRRFHRNLQGLIGEVA